MVTHEEHVVQMPLGWAGGHLNEQGSGNREWTPVSFLSPHIPSLWGLPLPLFL